MYIENITAYFRVADLQRSIRFYVDVLGFSLEWGGDAEMGPHLFSWPGWAVADAQYGRWEP